MESCANTLMRVPGTESCEKKYDILISNTDFTPMLDPLETTNIYNDPRYTKMRIN